MHYFIRDLMNRPKLSKEERDAKIGVCFDGDCCIGTDDNIYVYSKSINDWVNFSDKNREVINIEKD